MIDLNHISTLIFDFGGVIVELDKDRCVDNFKALGVADTDKFLGNFAQKGFFLRFEKGFISEADFRSGIREMTSRMLTDEDIDRAWCSFIVNIPKEKIELLISLRKRYKVLMLSNTNSIHIRFCRERYFREAGWRLEDCFDKCYFSYEMHMAKPDEEIFKALLDDAGLLPEECLFLDDGEQNIETAKRLGINSYCLKESEDLCALLGYK